MKKRTMKRMAASIIRTIGALCILLIGIECLLIATNWYDYRAISDFSFGSIFALYLIAAIMIIYGGYMISPIYISVLVHRAVNDSIDHVMINVDSFYEYEKFVEEQQFKNKINTLKRKYLW